MKYIYGARESEREKTSLHSVLVLPNEVLPRPLWTPGGWALMAEWSKLSAVVGTTVYTESLKAQT